MMRKYHVRFGGGARVPEGSPALPYLVQTAPCHYPTGMCFIPVRDIVARLFEDRSEEDYLTEAFNEALAWRQKVRTRFQALVGNSPQLMKALGEAYRAAQTDAPALITGEAGTGKELLAHAMLEVSGRKGHPFVARSLPDIPPEGNFFEVELFGHVRGAFTDARTEHKGLFREADGGTLFLDEIGDLVRRCQPAMKRALQEGVIRPVGGEKDIAVDVRIISATNRNLKDATASMQDLLARINRVHHDLGYTMPSLEGGTDHVTLSRYAHSYHRGTRCDELDRGRVCGPGTTL